MTAKDSNKKIVKAIRMDPGLVKQIEDIGSERNRTFSNMVNTMLMNELNNGFYKKGTARMQ